MTCAETIANRVSDLVQHIRMDDRGEGKACTFAKRLKDRNKRREQLKGKGTGNGAVTEWAYLNRLKNPLVCYHWIKMTFWQTPWNHACIK
jgi:hypothetical protein